MSRSALFRSESAFAVAAFFSLSAARAARFFAESAIALEATGAAAIAFGAGSRSDAESITAAVGAGCCDAESTTDAGGVCCNVESTTAAFTGAALSVESFFPVTFVRKIATAATVTSRPTAPSSIFFPLFCGRLGS